MRALQTTLLAAAAATLHAAAAMRPAALHPTAAKRPPAPMQPTVTRRCILAAPVLMPRRANALYDTKTVDAAKNTYDVADATKCKAYLPLLDASGKALDELTSNWDRIATDGDSLRRYLGTVGVTSPLFKIRGGLKGVLKAKDLPDAFDAVACVEINQCVGCTMERPSWLGRAVRKRHRHAIEQASRRWRGGRRDDSARTRRKILISTQAVAFAEASEAFLNNLQDAEGDAYGAQFADYSTSVGSGGQSPSATMLGKARKDVERAQRSYAELLRLLAPLR